MASNNAKNMENSTSLPWATDIHSPRGRDSGSPPPLKRSRSSEVASRGYSPDRARSPSRGNGAEMRESLLGQALEGGPTIHTNSSNQVGLIVSKMKGNSDSSLQAQSTGEDSNSSSTALSDRAGPVTPKTEPSDYPLLDDHPLLNTNGGGPGPGMMDQARTFPGALLGLQGLPGLLPGPSGMHNNGPDSFDYRSHQQQQQQQSKQQQQTQQQQQQQQQRKAQNSTDGKGNERHASSIGERTASASNSGIERNKTFRSNFSSNTSRNSNIERVIGFECPLCEAHLPTLVDMRQHIDVHYPRDSAICPVYECARRFAHPNSVRNHMRLKHAIQWEKMKNLKWSM